MVGLWKQIKFQHVDGPTISDSMYYVCVWHVSNARSPYAEISKKISKGEGV